MSLTLELLRTETDREPLFWPFNAGNGLMSAVPYDCPKAKKATSNTAHETTLVNNNNNASTKVRNGLSPNSKRHSYYECCVNVEVSALLEHWLGWDNKHQHHDANQSSGNVDTCSSPTQSWADRLVSHLVYSGDQLPTEQDPSIWVRKFCSEVGCDVLKKQDTNGKTLLHHLLSGAVKRNLASTAKILLESGASASIADANGDTPLHLIRHLMTNKIPMDEICSLVKVLLDSKPCANNNNLVDVLDAKGRTLLSYAVEAGDGCVALTRLLLNLQAKTFSDQLGHASAAFAWFLRAQMRKMKEAALDEETFYVLSHAMMDEVSNNGLKFKTILDRSMLAMGSSPDAHGPLFRRIRGLAAPYWLQPPQLRLLAVKSIRKSMGPKRLSNQEVTRLKVPRKLQRFVTLEEKIPDN